MILGRPTILWLGLVTSGLALLQLVLVQVVKTDPTATATILAAVGVALGSVITLVANQPPTVVAGATVTVQTPAGEPNRSVTVQ